MVTVSENMNDVYSKERHSNVLISKEENLNSLKIENKILRNI
jgi:hypothetical protein